jgi:transposase-like protein
VIESEKVTITGEDNLTEYKDFDTLSGNSVSRYFCKTCGKYVQRSLLHSARHDGSLIRDTVDVIS